MTLLTLRTLHLARHRPLSMESHATVSWLTCGSLRAMPNSSLKTDLQKRRYAWFLQAA